MRHALPAKAPCGLALLPAGSTAAKPVRPESGAYEIEVRLELPHLEDMARAKTVRVCLTEGSTAAERGIAVLSDNIPLARCPVSNLRWDRSVLTFDIAGEGATRRGGARASGSRLRPSGAGSP